MSQAGKPWRWTQLAHRTPAEWELRDGTGRLRCSVLQSRYGTRFTWHTWDTDGVGGENSDAATPEEAKDQAIAAIVRQGWAPGGWRVSW